MTRAPPSGGGLGRNAIRRRCFAHEILLVPVQGPLNVLRRIERQTLRELTPARSFRARTAQAGPRRQCKIARSYNAGKTDEVPAGAARRTPGRGGLPRLLGAARLLRRVEADPARPLSWLRRRSRHRRRYRSRRTRSAGRSSRRRSHCRLRWPSDRQPPGLDDGRSQPRDRPADPLGRRSRRRGHRLQPITPELASWQSWRITAGAGAAGGARDAARGAAARRVGGVQALGRFDGAGRLGLSRHDRRVLADAALPVCVGLARPAAARRACCCGFRS